MELYNGQPQHDAFASVKHTANVRKLPPSPSPYRFPAGVSVTLPESYRYGGVEKDLAELIAVTGTSALLVLRNGKVVYENYWLTGGPDVQWVSMSVAKSFTSALIGIALGEGLIEDIDDPIDRYVPFLKEGGYKGVSIRDVLRMSSGVKFAEEYHRAHEPQSDFARTMSNMMSGNSRDYVRSLPRAHAPGSLCNYNSNDTLTLGWVLTGVYERRLGDLLQEKLLDPLGMEDVGYFKTDITGDELAAGGLNLTARDYAKFGELYRLDGEWGDQQLIPAWYVADSTTVSSPQFAPGMVNLGSRGMHLGYGYQWWIPKSGTDFTALGVYNQFVYVNIKDGTVIVKLSSNPRYGASDLEEDNLDAQNVSALQAISAYVSSTM